MEQPPPVSLRLATTHGDRVRRVDVHVGAAGVGRAGEAVSRWVEDGVATTFPTEQLWSQVRALLPEVAPLRADPAGRPAPERRAPGPGFAERCRAFVAVTTVVADQPVALRGWLATDDELWASDPRPDGSTDLRPAAEGALADLLVWDVTGALQVALAAVGGSAS